MRVIFIHKLTWLLLISILTMVETSCFWDQLDVKEDGIIEFEKIWQSSDFMNSGFPENRVYDGVIYIPESIHYGMSATRFSDGASMWRITDMFRPNTNPVIYDNKLYFFSYRRSSQPSYLWILDPETGFVLGRVELSITASDPNMIQYEGWLTVYGDMLYFQISSFHEDEHGPAGIYRLDLSSLPPYEGEPVLVEPELFLPAGQYQRQSVCPVFEDDRVYIYLGGRGWDGPLPEGAELIGRRYYPQSAVRLYALTLGGEVIWETGFDHAGGVFAGTRLLSLQDNTLYLADAYGRAAVNKLNGIKLYEKKDRSAYERIVVDNTKIYASTGTELRCYNALTGELVWNNIHMFSRDANPVIWRNRLYMVDSDALHVYDKNTGRLLGRDQTLGIRAYRNAGYIPQVDDVMYVPRTEELVAIRLGSERYRGVK